MKSRITTAHVKTAFWLLAFIALTIVTLCKLYWPALPVMLVAFHCFEKNAGELHSNKNTAPAGTDAVLSY